MKTEILDDRRPIYAFEVKDAGGSDFSFVRWCGTLAQFEADCFEYCECSEGEWERVNGREIRFVQGAGSAKETTVFRARNAKSVRGVTSS